MDDFKTEFYRILDYYLRKIHENNPNVAISLSGGIDTNTIAAEWSKIFPDEKTVFFTSKIDDVTDESRLASFMQSCISNKIKYIPIKLEETNIIDELYSYMDSFVPPRFMNLLSQKYFYNQLKQNGITMPYVTGMGQMDYLENLEGNINGY